MFRQHYHCDQEQVRRLLNENNFICFGICVLLYRYVRKYKKLPNRKRFMEVMEHNLSFIAEANKNQLNKVGLEALVGPVEIQSQSRTGNMYGDLHVLASELSNNRNISVYKTLVMRNRLDLSHALAVVALKGADRVWMYDPNQGLFSAERGNVHSIKHMFQIVSSGYSWSELLRQKLDWKTNSKDMPVKWNYRCHNYYDVSKQFKFPVEYDEYNEIIFNLDNHGIGTATGGWKITWPFSIFDERQKDNEFLGKMNVRDNLSIVKNKTNYFFLRENLNNEFATLLVKKYPMPTYKDIKEGVLLEYQDNYFEEFNLQGYSLDNIANDIMSNYYQLLSKVSCSIKYNSSKATVLSKIVLEELKKYRIQEWKPK